MRSIGNIFDEVLQNAKIERTLNMIKATSKNALEFSRLRARWYDKEVYTPQAGHGMTSWKAVAIQALIEKNWATVSTYIDRPFPYIVYADWFLGQGMTTAKRGSENVLWINPRNMPLWLGATDQVQVPPIDAPLTTFIHELRHLEQMATGRLDAVKGKVIWEGRIFDKEDPRTDFKTYVEAPHEKDANTVAQKIYNTIVRKRHGET